MKLWSCLSLSVAIILVAIGTHEVNGEGFVPAFVSWFTNAIAPSQSGVPNTKKPPPKGQLISGRCFQEKDTGPCRASMEVYYFDTQKNMCAPFIYGGCAGNSNRFYTIAECRRHCGNRRG